MCPMLKKGKSDHEKKSQIFLDVDRTDVIV